MINRNLPHIIHIKEVRISYRWRKTTTQRPKRSALTLLLKKIYETTLLTISSLFLFQMSIYLMNNMVAFKLRSELVASINVEMEKRLD